MYNVRHYAGFDELPENCAPLTVVLARLGMFGEPEWFGYLMRRVFDETDEFRLYVVEDAGGRPLLLAPLRLSTAEHAVMGGRVITSISHPENYSVAALAFDDSVIDRADVLVALFRHLKDGVPGQEPPCDALRIWPVEDDSELADTVYTALRRAGLVVQIYANSYNRFESTAGVDYESYFAARSANHRYSVRRRQRALEKKAGFELALYTGGDLSQAIEDYRTVSLASWKQPHTMIALGTLEMIDMAARKGALRLGILRTEGVAVAAQFWVVTGGIAHCARLAYDETRKHLAPGVVLTNFMVAHVLDQDRVERIDFGYGTEDYKGGWMKDARFYFGFIGFNPRTWRGVLHGAKHIVGRPVKRLAKFVLETLHLRKRPEAEAGGEE